MICSHVPESSIYSAYRMAQIDSSYADVFVEQLLPFAVAVVDSISVNLDYDTEEDVISEVTILLWSSIQSLLKKEFSSIEFLLAYLSRRLRAQARALMGTGMSQVIEVGIDHDLLSGGVESTSTRANEADRRQWNKEYVKRNIRFTGARRIYCIRLVTQGRYALRGTVDADDEKFFVDYVSVLSRMGYREYVKA